MKLHSDLLTEQDIYEATKAAGMTHVTAEVTSRGSRSRKRGFEVHLTGTASNRPGHASAPKDSHGATWDEWGMFFQNLFEKDPDMVAGTAYNGMEGFTRSTHSRFESLLASDQHPRHKWVFSESHEGVSCDCGASRSN